MNFLSTKFGITNDGGLYAGFLIPVLLGVLCYIPFDLRVFEMVWVITILLYLLLRLAYLANGAVHWIRKIREKNFSKKEEILLDKFDVPIYNIRVVRRKCCYSSAGRAHPW